MFCTSRVPSHAWAVDARTGRKLWQFDWASKGGESIGNRGAAVKDNTLYFETEDCNLVAIDIATGKEKWHVSIGNPDQFYFGSVAPVIVKNHVMVGVSGDDFDIPGYIEAHDPETGALQWRWYTHPNPGEPEAKTWPNDEAMLHGGGMTWVPGTYDPELEPLLLRHRQRTACHQWRGTARGESVYVDHLRAEPGHRQTGLVLPAKSA